MQLSARVRIPVKAIDRVAGAVSGWSEFAAEAELGEEAMEAVKKQFVAV